MTTAKRRDTADRDVSLWASERALERDRARDLGHAILPRYGFADHSKLRINRQGRRLVAQNLSLDLIAARDLQPSWRRAYRRRWQESYKRTRS